MSALNVHNHMPREHGNTGSPGTLDQFPGRCGSGINYCRDFNSSRMEIERCRVRAVVVGEQRDIKTDASGL